MIELPRITTPSANAPNPFDTPSLAIEEITGIVTRNRNNRPQDIQVLDRVVPSLQTSSLSAQARRLRSVFQILQPSIAMVPEFADVSKFGSEYETALHLVQFYKELQIDGLPTFQGNFLEQANQIRTWMKGDKGRFIIENITHLDLARAKLTHLPPEIGLFQNLIELDLSDNKLTILPSEIGKLTKLTNLNLRSNLLQILPSEMKHLKELQFLEVSFNLLKTLPPEIGNLISLQELNLNFNKLVRLPPEIGKLISLQELNLCYNKLVRLPPEIGKLVSLKKLRLASNELTILPPEIRSLIALRELVLSFNQLRDLPSLTTLTNLTRFDILTNPLTYALNDEWRFRLPSQIYRNVTDSPAPSSTTLIPPYNMLKALSAPEERSPVIVRAAHITAPTFGPYITTLLEKCGAKAQDTDISLDTIDPTNLTKEVQEGILIIRQTGNVNRSVSATLLQMASPTSLIGIICSKAKHVMANADGLALPGGPDVEPEFYDNKYPLDSFRDYRRSIAEFALIDSSDNYKKPIIGTCRGAQIINVFFGGSLRNVDGQKGWQKVDLTNSSRKPQLETLFSGNTFTAYAFHNQACDKIAPGFEVIAHHNNIPKIIIRDDGLIIGTQVHPEKADGKQYSNVIRIYELFFKPIASKL